MNIRTTALETAEPPNLVVSFIPEASGLVQRNEFRRCESDTAGHKPESAKTLIAVPASIPTTKVQKLI